MDVKFRSLLAGATIVTMLSLSACGSNKSLLDSISLPTSSETTDSSVAPASSPTPIEWPTPSETADEWSSPSQTAEAVDAAEVGDTLQEGGVKLTLDSFKKVASVDVNRSGYKTGSRYAKITKLKAEKGAKLYRADTTIENIGRKSMDLTCGYEVDIKVLSDRNQEYRPLGDMYQTVGNPGCNDELQPGFSAKMSWIFKLPKDVEPVAIYFVDPLDDGQFSGSQDYQIFTLDPNVTLRITER